MILFFRYGEILDFAASLQNIPKVPNKWILKTGWTAYDQFTGEAYSVDYPDEDMLFFDVEVCVQDGQLPTLAVALSSTRWYFVFVDYLLGINFFRYSWCSDRLVNLSEYPTFPRLKHLIPLESSNTNFSFFKSFEKIVIGHNIAYDRSRVAEQYLQKVF